MKRLSNMVHAFFLREGASLPLICLLIALDSLLSAVIIWKVPYTEIDWKAYMEEVAGYEGGERDYTKIEGCTGPLVYPAGFLYIFSFLKSVTSNGSDILRAQVIFAGLYILTLAVSLILYNKGRFPAFCAIFLILSKRVHSIFMLRMFNDCIAVLLGLVAVVCFCTRSWKLGSVVYSISVSIKMNMLLYAPGVLAVYLLNLGYLGAVENIAICGIVQLVLGYPFLTTYPVAYISKAFELSRVFFYKWTVNFKFLPEDVFLDKRLSILLLGLTVAAYVAFSIKWTMEFCKGFQQHSKEKLSLTSQKTSIGQFVSWNFITYVIFASNFIGIAFARSLHYQFYCWYFFTLPFLLFQSYLHEVLSIAVLGGFEYAFNVFPATALSSSVLQICHVLVLVALWFSRVPFREGETIAKLYVESLQTKRK